MASSSSSDTKNPGLDYLHAAEDLVRHIRETQIDAIEEAAEICARSISEDALVHLFGTGHSRIPIEEIFPRHGSFPGFHPIVELSLTYHNPVVGANGQRQAMFIEHVEGLGERILRNFVLQPPDSFIVFSNSGVNEVVVEVALEAKERDLPVIVVVSEEHCLASTPKHSSGQRLPDVADVVIDNGAPGGDAMIDVDGVDDPVGPASTLGYAAVVNALKCLVAKNLADLGHPPTILSSSYVLGAEASEKRFEVCYDEYRDRVRRAYGGTRNHSDQTPQDK